MTDERPSNEQSWLDNLQKSGYRLTGPRRALVEIIARSERALSAMDIFDLGRREISGLGLVTVYRTLEKLEALGLIQRVHHPEGCHRYLRASHGHEHLLMCTACGRVEFFSGDDLAPLCSSLSERTGFQIQDHWLQLSGLCDLCKNPA
jgi:Fe2+ or Zn2+ uptake regulation protein